MSAASFALSLRERRPTRRQRRRTANQQAVIDDLARTLGENGQALLSDSVPQRSHEARETDDLYNAVRLLRSKGYRVYKGRAGQHFVNGSIRTSSELFALAESL